jgi:large subunit ribosomal protein L18e
MENPVLKHTVVRLERASKEKDARIWKKGAEMLGSQTKNFPVVNVGHLSHISKKGSAIFVPGKVLGAGQVDKKIIVGAFHFSKSALEKINDAGGEAIQIEELVKRYPDGGGVIIVG